MANDQDQEGRDGSVGDISNGSTATEAHSNEETQIRGLVQRWADLERTQDADGFDALLTSRFTGIGPVEFVLDARQWADRHRGGGVINHAFEVTDLEVVVEGDTAIVHAVETQRTTARGHENNGSFRAGLILVGTAAIGGSPGFNSPVR